MKKATLIIFLVILLACLSYFLAHYTINSDFPVFYYAASTVCDPSTPNTLIYDADLPNQYSEPEQNLGRNYFIYSMPVAFLIAPLGLLSYYNAKTVMVFIGIACYLSAVAIILHINQAKDRWLMYPLLLSGLFFPFLQDLRMAQVNCVILLIVTLAALSAKKERPYLCGLLLAFAALFKIFPIAIAMVLGLKNWRIIATCTIVFVSSFLIPGSLEWIPSIINIHRSDYVPLFIVLGWFWFIPYAATVSLFTAFIAFRAKNIDYPLLVSFSIPAVLLTMPLVEYYHLVLMALPYIYILTRYKTDRFLTRSMLFSFTMISTAFFFSRASIYFPVNPPLSKALVTLGLVSLWGALAWELSHVQIKKMG